MKIIAASEEQKKTLAKAIRSVGLFTELDDIAINFIISQSSPCQYVDQEKIIRQGDESDSFLIMLRGHATIWVETITGDPIKVGKMGPLESLGEMGLILEQPRSATVIAEGTVIAFLFSKKSFDRLLATNATFGRSLTMQLAKRLENSSKQIPLKTVSPTQIPAVDIMKMIPTDMVFRHKILPIRGNDHFMELGFVDPLKPQLLARIQERDMAKEITPVSISEEFFHEATKLLAEQSPENVSENQENSVYSESLYSESDTLMPQSPVLERLLRKVVSDGASDLHLTSSYRPRWRVDGEIKEMKTEPVLTTQTAFEWLQPLMSEKDIHEFETTKDSDFAVSLGDIARFRVNLFQDHQGTGAVLRQIPSKILSLEQLGLPSVIREFSQLPKGLVLVTGPTGSGKSTTLAAMIDFINKTRDEHIITLEDPIEFVHTSKHCLVNQREIGTHTNSFNRALRAALRQDPDIVLVGELRDLETIQLAMEVANTGHLVFATLHTSTAVTTVDRIVDMFPTEQQNQVRTSLSEVLKGVVSQTLCKKINGGRVAALEILVVNAAIANLIREGKTSQMTSIMQTGSKQGNRLLNDSLTKLIKDNVISYEEANSKALDKDGLAQKNGRKQAYRM